MKGDPKILDRLNFLLADELTAISQYMVHSEMCANWEYKRLHEAIEKRAIDEMKHAEKLIARILFLEGRPIVSKLNEMHVGADIPGFLTNDEAAESGAIRAYNASDGAALWSTQLPGYWYLGLPNAYGGIVFHDVIKVRHAEKALEAGVDGLIAVCGGAGGHAGSLNPFALVNELRRIHQGPLVLAGAITNGAGVLAAEAMGCDLAYLGTRFIATKESMAVEHYKQMIVDSNSGDIVYTPLFSGVHGSYLAGSIRNAGLDPDNLPVNEAPGLYRSREERPKTWKEIWGAGQGVGNIDDIPTVAELVDRLEAEYFAARRRIADS